MFLHYAIGSRKNQEFKRFIETLQNLFEFYDNMQADGQPKVVDLLNEINFKTLN